MMRLICKIKENDRRGISNHDTWKENHLKKTHGSHICHHYNARNSCSMQPLALTAPIHAPFAVSCAMGPLGAPEINLSDVLYIHMTPYIPSAWLTALSLKTYWPLSLIWCMS